MRGKELAGNKVWSDYWLSKGAKKLSPYEKLWYPYLSAIQRESVIEIGSGSGRGLDAIQAKRKVGVDISEEAIKIAKKQCPAGEFILADTSKGLPFRKNEFDLLISSGLLEHFYPFPEENIKVLKEWLRIAKEALIVVPSKYSPLAWGFTIMEYARGREEGYFRPMSKRELIKIIGSAGGEITDYRTFLYRYAHAFWIK